MPNTMDFFFVIFRQNEYQYEKAHESGENDVDGEVHI